MSYQNNQSLSLEQLEPRLLLSGVSDLLELASFLSVATPADMEFSGSINAPKQPVVYQFTAEATSRLVVDMVAEDGQLDPCLTLYNAKGRRRKRNNNAYRGTLDSRMVYIVDPGQTYYIRAEGRRKTTGQFRIRIQTALEDEYGDALAAAEAIRLSRSGRKRLNASIDHGADVDVIRFVATKTGRMTVQQSPRRRRDSLDCLVYVYDAAGGLLASNEATIGTSPNTVSLDVDEGQVYFVAVSAHQQATGKYRLKVTTKRVRQPRPGPLPPPPEPDPPIDPGPQPDPPGDVVPGEQVAVQTFECAGGLQLWVLGTDLADSIMLTQTAGGITLACGAGSEEFTGTYCGVIVYGFGGDDDIRLDGSLTLSDTIYAGDGNDWIFDAGAAGGVIYAGAGDDLLVSVGGSADSAYGGEGLDSFWVDGADVIGDPSAAETDATAVHQIAQFYQPYTTDPGAPGYVSLEIAGQDLADPAITGYAIGYADFSDRPAFVDGPDYSDIIQGSVGDCYMLATLASLADADPQVIEQMIAPLGDGTYAVRFYDGTTPVYLRVDGDLPVTSSGGLAYAELSDAGESWVPLVEKAYAYFRYGENSYASLHGGWMTDVYRHVAGSSATYRSTTTLGDGLYSFLYTQLASGHAITLGSRYTASTPVVPAHAYMVKEVHIADGQWHVTVYNPWGVDGRTWDDNYSDGLLTLTVDQVIQHFSAAVAC